MIPDSLFSSPQSQCFFLLKVQFSPFSEFRFLPSKSPVPILSVLFQPLSSSSFLLSKSHSRPLPSSFVLSHPTPPRIIENSGTTRSRPAVLGLCG